jgi:polyketide synthase 12
MRRTNDPKYHDIAQLVVSGSIAPQLTVPWKNRDSIKETAQIHNSVEKIMSTISYIDDESFLRKILPVMRNDMKMIMGYRYVQEDKLDIPILAFGAIEDEVVLIDELKQWKDQTNNSFTLHEVHGDHWFLSRNQDFILKKIEESLIEEKIRNIG